MKLENLARANELSKARQVCLDRIYIQEKILDNLKIGNNLNYYGAVQDMTDGEGYNKTWEEQSKCIRLFFDDTYEGTIYVNIEVYKSMLETNIKLVKEKLANIDKELETL